MIGNCGQFCMQIATDRPSDTGAHLTSRLVVQQSKIAEVRVDERCASARCRATRFVRGPHRVTFAQHAPFNLYEADSDDVL
jgi:hypothetical protein